ncbi:MAG: CARDB domain-containing protein, partial [Candidatus Krumholzibacteriia bacterium]
VADTVALPDPWYRAPDLVARRATVDTVMEYAETDTVRVGQPFLVMANHLRWTERGTPGWMHVEIYLDSVLVQRSEHALGPNLHWGSDVDASCQYRSCRLTVQEPGVHTLTVVVDADGVLAETDETNNTHTRTFVAVP